MLTSNLEKTSVLYVALALIKKNGCSIQSLGDTK
jgi:hypothetical protein